MASKKKMSAGERRAQLVGVGRRVFADCGYEATTVEEIAKRAKVSKPIVYQHFGGKEGLYAVVVDREMSQIISDITEAIGSGSPRRRVEGAFLAFLSYAEACPDGFRVLSQDAPVSEGRGMPSVMSEVARRVGAVFAENFKAAGFDVKAAPIYAHAMVGMVAAVAEWWVEAGKPKVEVVASHLAAMAWMGLRHLPKKPEKLARKRMK